MVSETLYLLLEFNLHNIQKRQDCYSPHLQTEEMEVQRGGQVKSPAQVVASI